MPTCAFCGRDVSEERRLKLREVELKVVAYQDDLESGQRSVKTGYTLQEQVQHYRTKLMRKVRTDTPPPPPAPPETGPVGGVR